MMNEGNSTATAIKVGDVVMLSRPECGAEAALRFEVAEINGDRGFMRLLNSRLPLPPVELFRVADVEPAN